MKSLGFTASQGSSLGQTTFNQTLISKTSTKASATPLKNQLGTNYYLPARVTKSRNERLGPRSQTTLNIRDILKPQHPP